MPTLWSTAGARAWAVKLRVWLMPPGWRPADMAARWPKPAFDLAAVKRFGPPLSPRAAAPWAIGALTQPRGTVER